MVSFKNVKWYYYLLWILAALAGVYIGTPRSRADLIDLPPEQRQHNDSGVDCVHCAITNLLRIAGRHQEADEFWKRFGRTGTDDPSGLARKLDSMGIGYWQGKGSKEILLQAVKDGRGAAVGLNGNHMVNVVGGDDETVVLMGNMNIDRNKTQTWPEFLREFDGWTVILTGDRKPSKPAESPQAESKVKPTDWPYCCVADIQCGNSGGSATLVGINGTIGIAATAAHVVENGDSVSLRFPDGYKCKGSVIGRDTKRDLAAIRLTVKEGMVTPRGIRAARESDKTVLAVGFPFYSEAGIPHWTTGPYLNYSGFDVHFKARPYIHSGFSGGMLISMDGYYLGSTNGYGDDYSYAASGEAMTRFLSRWVKVEEQP